MEKGINDEEAKLVESEPKPDDESQEDCKSLPSGPADAKDDEVPIAVSVTLFEAICLYKGSRVIASKGKEITNWKFHQLFLHCCCGIIAGVVGGLLGLGGGFILGPLFLELGIPPQVASATSTFAMFFSASMSVVQYYLLAKNGTNTSSSTYITIVQQLLAKNGMSTSSSTY